MYMLAVDLSLTAHYRLDESRRDRVPLGYTKSTMAINTMRQT